MGIKQAMAAIVLSALASVAAYGQPSNTGTGADMQVTAAQRQQMIDRVVEEVGANYAFPDLARKAGAALRARQRHGVYEGVHSARALAEGLTTALQATTGDRHLRVVYSEQAIPESKPDVAPAPEDIARRLAMLRSTNFGVAKVELLPFNVGYLNLVGFAPAQDAAGTIAAAMTILAHTDALVIDLRDNGGGDAAAVTLLASYLFDGRTQLNDFYYRQGDRIEQRWTWDAVPGLRYGQKKDVVVLTSKFTFSAAEDFAYALKNLKRVTVVGETTAGGANPGNDIRLAPHFSAFVPLGRAISPVTGTNWEGVGVMPDVSVCADAALASAQVAILTTLAISEANPVTRDDLAKRIAALGADIRCP